MFFHSPQNMLASGFPRSSVSPQQDFLVTETSMRFRQAPGDQATFRRGNLLPLYPAGMRDEGSNVNFSLEIAANAR